MRNLPYKIGDVFGVPLDSGGFALGLVARMPPKGKSFLGYFFGPVHKKCPSLSEIPVLTKDDAILVAILGDLCLYKGSWLIIGNLEPWIPERWPMPQFIRTDIISGENLLIEFADGNPDVIIAETPIGKQKAKNLPEDGLWGCGAVEEKLTELLESSGASRV